MKLYFVGKNKNALKEVFNFLHKTRNLLNFVKEMVKLFKNFKKSPKKAILFSLLVIIFIIAVVFFIIALQNPKIESNEVVQIEVKSISALKLPKTTYMYHDVTNDVKIVGDINYNEIGEYEVEYEVPTMFKTYIKKQTIKIVDTTLPEITLEGGDVINQSYAEKYQELGVTAIDNYDGDITEKITTEEKQIDESKIEIIYTVSDSSGNIATKTRTVNIVDDVPPVITLNGYAKMSIIKGNQYKEQGAKAIDEKDRRFDRQNTNRRNC